MVTVWLAIPDLGTWVGIFESALSHTILQVIIACMMDRQHKYIYILNTSL